MKSYFWILIIISIIYRLIIKPKIKQYNQYGSKQKNQFSLDQILQKLENKNTPKQDPGYNPNNVYKTEFDMTKKQGNTRRVSDAKRSKPNSRINYSDPSWVKDEDTWIKGE